jgi:septal ring-binding cell division protein DamX
MDYSRDEDGLPRKERELTLNMSAILGIFFGLVLLCGLFFGLGYNMRGRQISSAAGSDADAENTTNPEFNNFKPAAGSPAGSKPAVVVPLDGTQPGATTTPANVASVSPANLHAVAPANTAAPTTGAQSSPAPVVRLAPETAPDKPGATGSVATTVQPPAPAQMATGSFIVQVAAVSHQEDADLLLSALKGRGYAVVERTEPQDKLVHIQIGPFSYRKDAEAMRQRLLSDGYNAIIK